MNLVQETPIAAECRRSDPSIFRAIHAVNESLQALEDFISELRDAQYVARPAGGMSTIGSHVRHCLDHVDALMRGIADGFVDYDDRQRGTDVERSRTAALHRLAELRRFLDQSAPSKERYLCVRAMLTPDGETVRSHSSWSRELVFVLSHTIHHQAMMASAAQTLGASVSPRFGCAPSTLAYRDQSPCVRSA